jgi:hypothetical protein
MPNFIKPPSLPSFGRSAYHLGEPVDAARDAIHPAHTEWKAFVWK